MRAEAVEWVHLWVPDRASGVVRTLPGWLVPYRGDWCRWQWGSVPYGPGMCDTDPRACTPHRCPECHGGPVRCYWCRPGRLCRECYGTGRGGCETCVPQERSPVGPCAILCQPVLEDPCALSV